MGDTVQEIEDAVTKLQGVLPILSTVVGVFVPQASTVTALATPVLSIINEIMAAIETLKGTGMSHQAAAAVIGTAVTSIGQTISASVPANAADAAAPASVPPAPTPAVGTSNPPHESH